jgi:glyoxylase-like metal-dependent hydrolase (beta-lactamase superfamily II)
VRLKEVIMRAGSHPTRREIIARSLIAAVAISAGGVPVFADTRAAQGIHKLTLGELDITILSDGILTIATRLLNRDMAEDDIEAAIGSALSAPGQVQYGVNIVLVRAGAELLLVDAGGGSTFVPTTGKLDARLKAAGIDPAAITKVVITHGHPDHLGGLVDEFDEPRFPNAQHIMPAPELDYWRKVDVTTLPDRMQGVAVGAKRVIGTVEERLVAAGPDAEIAPGIAYISTPGHTPGHCSVRVASGSHGLIVTADTLFHPITSFAHPEWQPVADMDGAEAVASRRRLLDMAATDRLQLASYHIPFPGLGRVERHGTAYRWLA